MQLPLRSSHDVYYKECNVHVYGYRQTVEGGMRRLSRGVTIGLLAAFGMSSLQIWAAPLAWATPLDFYRYPLSHTGYYPQAYVAPSPQLHKRYGLVNIGRYGASKSSPLVDQGIIYVGADDGHLYAIREADMSLAWSFRVRPQARQGIHATPALDDQHVYIGAYDGWLYALNKATGRLVWQTRLGDSIGSSAVIWGNRLYVGVETIKREGYLSCVNKNTGKHVYSTDNFGHHTHATPTINPDTATVFMGANSHRFFAIDANTGKLKWTYDTGGPIKSTAALVEGDVLFTSWDGHLYKLSQQTGALVWRFKSNDQSMSSPAIDTDRRVVYFGSRDKLLYRGSRRRQKTLVVPHPGRDSQLAGYREKFGCDGKNRHLWLQRQLAIWARRRFGPPVISISHARPCHQCATRQRPADLRQWR